MSDFGWHDLNGIISDQYLNNDYKQLVEKLIVKMKRKRQVPFLRGRVWHPEFSTHDMRDSDPHKDKVMIDGFIVPIRMLSPELQEELRRRGIA